MALSKEEYQALEDIVGPENISDDPAILDSYAFQMSAELVSPDQSKFLQRAEAALLPGSTEEVQAIVRTCNRYRIKYKAYSTGWGPWNALAAENTIQLDLRRMDRILEIDEKNMFAVVEPYAILATLQTEAMKVGLNCQMIGAGASCSALAPCCIGMPGEGPGSIYMGNASENLLAMEWVMPNGDILRTGSLGSGDGWFCGEGPGPSLRGIARGFMGTVGGLGVFTKCAIKLSPWPGPAELPVEGIGPAYSLLLPDNFRSYSLAFPNWQAYANAYYKIWDSEIGYIHTRQLGVFGGDLGPVLFKEIFSDATKTLNDLEEALKDPEIQKLIEEMRMSFEIVLAGMTPSDIEYQEKVLSQILAETGGWKVAAMAEPAMQRFKFLFLIALSTKNLKYCHTGAHGSTLSQVGTPDFVIQQIPVMNEVMRKYQEKGFIVKGGEDSLMGSAACMGGGTYCKFGQHAHYDPHDKEAVKKVAEYVKEGERALREHGWVPGLKEVGFSRMTKKEHQSALASVSQPITYQWQRKIKEMLDPGDTGSGDYNIGSKKA